MNQRLGLSGDMLPMSARPQPAVRVRERALVLLEENDLEWLGDVLDLLQQLEELLRRSGGDGEDAQRPPARLDQGAQPALDQVLAVMHRAGSARLVEHQA